MIDWGGKVAAWFAGVAGVSVALATLIATTAKQPLHAWMNTLFIVLVVVAVLSFIMLLLTGPRAAWAAWRNRRVRDGADRVAGLQPLLVEITEAQFDNWKYVVLIVALRVKITNTTGQIIRLRGIGFTHDAEGDPGWSTIATADERLEIDRELHARRERQHYGIPLRNYSMVPPDEVISGWVIEAVTRRVSGTPRCTVIVRDTIGNQYEAVLPKRDARTYGP